ncbi:pectate lyase [Sphingosinicella sp. BN140058]|uniref:pectate lyase n=1 Tax=Sphingosinicella sp. BN140058 TaxID=1892855 RepID=UPI00101211DA|nr:pectate lyase [Sphingosinicella sp. BN140058]QAY77463.1 pectate lyase [Sphingosinicella sp. BN140058]
MISRISRTMAAGLALCVLAGPMPAIAKVIGTNVPAQSLTHERIAALPAAERAAWAAYLRRSEAQMRADRASLAAELPAGATPPPPPQAVGGGKGNMPLDRDASWYGGTEARAVADTIVSFQTPAGGWSKNQDRAIAPRRPGQRFANDAETMDPDRSNFDAPADRFWTFVGTLDNDATTTEMRFLARVAEQLPAAEAARYRASFVKGVRYLLAAQYPNGGWPQNWPLEGGFHDAITFNDNAVAHAATLLQEVAAGGARYGFVPADLRRQAARAADRGIAIIIRAQVRIGGTLAGWPQQVDPLTLAPSSARNYEPQSIASAETTDILLFLMQQPRPSSAVNAAIRGGIAWLKAKAIYNQAWTHTPEGRKIVPQQGAGPIWSRNYSITTGQPIFGDKDKSIHDDVNFISIGRRNGYNWYVTSPQQAIDAFAKWSSNNPG